MFERFRRDGPGGGTAVAERNGQVGGFGGDMQARPEALPLERKLLGETLANASQHGHLLVVPFDPAASFGGKLQVQYVMALAAACAPRRRHGFALDGSWFHVSLAPKKCIGEFDSLAGPI